MAPDVCHDHEMIEIPVEDRRERELREVVQLEPHGSGSQMEVRRDLDEGSEGRSFERDRVMLPETGQVGAMAMKRRDHCQTREAALGPLRLQDHGCGFPTREGEPRVRQHA